MTIATEPRSTCLMCGGPGVVAYAGLTDRFLHVPGAWDLRRCADPACGLGWLDPMPTEADVGKAYAGYYTHEDWAPAEAAAAPTVASPRGALRGLAVRAALAPYTAFARLAGIDAARARMRLMWLDGRPPGRLLEVGCGSGFHMVWLAERGWEVEGQEIDPAAAETLRRARGFTVHAGPLLGLGLPGGRYDAVALNHVLEHVHRPAELLAEARRLLKPGGRLVLAVPNFASYGLAEAYGPAWAGLDPPRHLWHFRRHHVERLAHEAGLTNVAVTTTSANAELIGGLSRRFATGAGPSLKGDLAAKWFQARAWLAQRRDPDRGEDLVLEADAPA